MHAHNLCTVYLPHMREYNFSVLEFTKKREAPKTDKWANANTFIFKYSFSFKSLVLILVRENSINPLK